MTGKPTTQIVVGLPVIMNNQNLTCQLLITYQLFNKYI